MPSFSFSVSKKSEYHHPRVAKPKAFDKNVQGVVGIDLEANYYVRFNDKHYNIAKKSYSCKGYVKVYRQAYPHSIRCVRNRLIEDLGELDNRFWLPFAPGNIVKGNIIMEGIDKVFEITDIDTDQFNNIAQEEFAFYRKHKQEIDDIIRRKQFEYD